MTRALTLLLLTLVLTMTGAAFAASFVALLGAASAIGLPVGAAYAFAAVPDLAAGVALLALLVLRHDAKARKIALASLVVFAGASGVLNGAAALGEIPHGLVEEPVAALPVWLALTTSAVPVLGVVAGADLSMRVLAALWPAVEVSPLPSRSSRASRSSSPRSPRSAVAAGSEGKSLPEPEPALLDRARALARDLSREGQRVNRDAVKTRLGVGTKRAADLMRALRAEELV